MAGAGIGLGQEIYKISLENLTVLKYKEMLKIHTQRWSYVKGTDMPTERTLMDRGRRVRARK